MKIKIATSNKERKQVYKVRTTVFVDEQNVSIEEEIDEYEDEAIHFVGIENGLPIAASRLRWVGQMGKLERICILKNHRGKSYGTKMIEAMEEQVIEKGYTQTKLHAQTQALKFYERLGYEVISDEFLDAGIPHVAMTKQLTKTFS